ncbi:hypothetical protein P691DRAFT_664722 [Macrolepiota fuliginosa MF-IS2]|uniref:DUF7729 domain-containing protein n=1 Tax=Macrolepiota fuliginosa MF-IS2 TaxID=1400762 RepID=A0A9P6C6D9_9AGAR|nr:hypothetical protein P691DRAFT_664722 [Macrolepiota fuliginosa MF-IS2]
MKTLAVISLFATSALAQSAAPQPSGNPLIPSGISSGCSDFINAFNSDSSLTSCTKSLIQATQNFGPGGSAGSSPTKAQITTAVDSICTGSASSACPDSLIRGKLTDFYAACSDELTSTPNTQIRDMYDVLYVLTPLKAAICSKDDSSNYCLLADSNGTSSGIQGALASAAGVDLSQIQNSLSYPSSSGPLSSRAEDPVVANLTTFRASNLAFLFREPQMDPSILCTTCTRNVLTGYFNFESDSDVLYAPGLSNSLLLGGQNELVGSIQQKCGANFLNGAVQAAGGIKQGQFGSGAVKGVSDRFSCLVAVVAGALTVAISSLL